jgi:hypothetical protein
MPSRIACHGARGSTLLLISPDLQNFGDLFMSMKMGGGTNRLNTAVQRVGWMPISDCFLYISSFDLARTK